MLMALYEKCIAQKYIPPSVFLKKTFIMNGCTLYFCTCIHLYAHLDGRQAVPPYTLASELLMHMQAHIPTCVSTLQESWIQHATVRENILFGKEFKADKYERVIHACALQQVIVIILRISPTSYIQCTNYCVCFDRAIKIQTSSLFYINFMKP